MRIVLKIILYIFLKALVVKSKDDHDIFILGNNHCITNSSSAITFIGGNTDNLEKSVIYPRIGESTFSCTFDKLNECSDQWSVLSNWQIQRSTEVLQPEIIKDWRWENFRTWKTYNNGNSLLNIQQVNLYMHENISIPLSIKTEKGVHVYLCDGTGSEPHTSNCYWIQLGAYDRSVSFIRKCYKNFIPYQRGIFAKGECRDRRSEKLGDPFIKKFWNHFVILKIENSIKVFDDNKDLIMQYNDDQFFTLQKLFIQSEGDALWRVHSYSFLESRTLGKKQRIGPALRPNNGEICVSMFIKTSINTYLTIIIKQIVVNGIKLIEKSISTNGTWEEMKLFKNDVPDRKYYIHFLQPELTSNDYWAVDEVRECHEKEYRYIYAEGNELICQKIEDFAILTWDRKTKLNTRNIGCPENSFGVGCVPCNLLGNEYCDSFKYCQLLDDTRECFCSAGFQNISCDQPCEHGQFGHGCKKVGHCMGKQRPVTGECTGQCQKPFFGNACDIPSQPFFKNPPVITGIKENSFEITQFDLQYEGIGIDYRFQYAEFKENINKINWITIEPPIDLNISKTIIVEDGFGDNVVKADTNYTARSLISGLSKQNVDYQEIEYLPVHSFTTNCIPLTEEDITIKPCNTSAIVELKISSLSCKVDRYSYLVLTAESYYSDAKQTNKKYEPIVQSINITGLHPNTDYIFLFTYKSSPNNSTRTKKFITKEGVPGQIRDPNFSNITPYEVTVTWQEPYQTNGKIQYYQVDYKVVKPLACPSVNETNNYVTKEVYETTLELKPLTPYTKYEMNIRGYTMAGLGTDFKKYFNTTATTDITSSEKIIISSVTPSQSSIDVTLDAPYNCSNLFGPIFLKFDITNVQIYTNISTVYQKYEYGSVMNIAENLYPFSNYTITLSISKTNYSDWINTSSKDFSTPPDVPLEVSDLRIYSKTAEYISIRWKQPSPRTGILEKYAISYGYVYWETWYNKTKVVAPEQCQVWQEYHCATITLNIYKGYTYYVKVAAKNKGTGYGAFTKDIIVVVLADEEGPEPPYNISYYWTDENDLYFSMNHPNNTNGDLKSFDIKINQIGTINRRVDKKYMLTYTYKIPIIFAACERFHFYIRAHNEFKAGEYTTVDEFKFPPLKPSNNTSFHCNKTNTTITLDISIEDSVETIDLVYIAVSPNDNTEDLLEFKKALSENREVLRNLNMVYEAKNINSSIHFEIGNNISSANFSNPALEPGTNYSIAIFMINRCNGYTRSNVLQKYELTYGTQHITDDSTTQEPYIGNEGNNGLWSLVLLLVVPLMIFGIWYFKKQQPGISSLVKPQSKSDDQIALTDHLTGNPPIKNPRVNIVKPRHSITLPALTTKHSQKIRIIDFENYVKESIENGELERQHNLFAKGLLRSHEVGSSPENKNRNRYKNLIAYDHTRVKLIRHGGSTESDYINANYIDGYKKPRTYIATQGPKLNTLNDFWIMIWQTNVKYIVMLANIYENGKKKVEKYWPDINENKQYGEITVHYISSTVFANFDEREFTVSYNGKERKIKQLHFTTWPDHGVPLYSQSLVPFLQKLLKIPYSTQSPILIHCSAGVGRTGTIILSDICLRMAAGEGFIDFLAHLENLRNQRANLVDNIEQYKLAHLVVLECLFGMRTTIPCNEDMQTIIESTISNNGIRTQMKYILETKWHDSAMEAMLENEEDAPIYPEKNRFPDIIPDQYRLYITKYPYEDESSSYINAILVDGFRSPGRFIVTQQPMPNTLGDFWRMVWERSCTVIISLNSINLKDETCCQVWPEKGEELQPVDFIKIVHKKTQRLDFYRIITVEVSAAQTATNSSIVNIVAMNNWRPQDLLPNSIEELLTFIDAAYGVSRTSENVIVTCYDGAKASGLYVAMSFLIEQMKLEQECDVCLAVRTIRHSRKQFVTTEEQYEFLYRAALTFITGFQSYSNFA